MRENSETEEGGINLKTLKSKKKKKIEEITGSGRVDASGQESPWGGRGPGLVGETAFAEGRKPFRRRYHKKNRREKERDKERKKKFSGQGWSRGKGTNSTTAGTSPKKGKPYHESDRGAGVPRGQGSSSICCGPSFKKRQGARKTLSSKKVSQ